MKSFGNGSKKIWLKKILVKKNQVRKKIGSKQNWQGEGWDKNLVEEKKSLLFGVKKILRSWSLCSAWLSLSLSLDLVTWVVVGGGGLFFALYLVQLGLGQVAYQKLVLYLAWKCLKSSCGWWWFIGKIIDQLWLSFSLALAKPNKN